MLDLLSNQRNSNWNHSEVPCYTYLMAKNHKGALVKMWTNDAHKILLQVETL